MATNIPQIDAAHLIEINESLIRMNQEIDGFKTNLGNSLTIDSKFKQIKNTWQQYKSYATFGQEAHYQIIDISLGRTEKRVQKLLTKFPPVLNPIQQIAQRANQLGYISFYDAHTDALTDCFGNFFDCKIEFGGKYYLNSESVFQAQKFTDQYGIMSQFENISGDVAVSLARKNKMTTKRSQEWHDLNAHHINKLDVMMNALRAKFGQNPHLKAMLMATGSAYLVEHLPDRHRQDRYWSDGFDGSGGNNLGNCLMRLREEYGGTGVVQKPQQYFLMLQNQGNSTHLQQNIVPSTPLQDRCIQCHAWPKFYDVTIGKLHEYCSKACAELSTKCIHCHQQPKFVDKTAGKVHDYCGAYCAKQAGALK